MKWRSTTASLFRNGSTPPRFGPSAETARSRLLDVLRTTIIEEESNIRGTPERSARPNPDGHAPPSRNFLLKTDNGIRRAAQVFGAYFTKKKGSWADVRFRFDPGGGHSESFVRGDSGRGEFLKPRSPVCFSRCASQSRLTFGQSSESPGPLPWPASG